MRYNLILLSLLLLSFVASAQTDKAPTSPVAKPVTSYQSIVGKDTSYYAYQNGVWFQLVGRAWLKSNYGPPSGYTGLTTTISGSNAITTAGSWFINGKPYSKTTTTTTAITPITTSGQLREDILYADTLNGIHLQMGVTGSTSTPPDIPANTIPIANIYTSSTGSTSNPAGSGFVPYNNWASDVNGGTRSMKAGNFFVNNSNGSGFYAMYNQSNNSYVKSLATTGTNFLFGYNGLSWLPPTGFGNFTRTFTGTNTADRVYTLPDSSGRVITSSNSITINGVKQHLDVNPSFTVGGGGGSNITQSYFHSLTNNDVNMGDSVTNKAIVNVSPTNESVTLSTNDPSGSSGVLLNEYNQVTMTQTNALSKIQSIGMGEAYNDGIHVYDSQNNIYFKYNTQPSYINPSHDLMLATAHYADSLKATASNIYNTDGALTTDRNLDLAGHELIIGVNNTGADIDESGNEVNLYAGDGITTSTIDLTNVKAVFNINYSGVRQEIGLTPNAMTILDQKNQRGMVEFADYSPHYTPLSLINKTYALKIADSLASVASSDLTAQSASNTNVATYTTTSIGTFRIGGYVNITAVAVDVIEMQVTYTDENSNVQTVNFFNQGATSALLSAIGNSIFPPMDIRCKTGTSITVKTTLTTGSGTITYDTGATITKLR